MSSYHVFEYDRCGKKVNTDSLPQYWASIQVYDSNRLAYGNSKYQKDICQRCMDEVRVKLERLPEAA